MTLGKGSELANDDAGHTYGTIRFGVTKESERKPQPGARQHQNRNG